MGYFLTEKKSGNTVTLTNHGQAVVDTFRYTAYGLLAHQQNRHDTPFLYAGQFGVMTEANGLLHMRARYYSPELRRFINADPIGFDGGLNWYQYAAGNPIMYVDPSGNFGILGAGGGFLLGGITGGVIAAVTGGDILAGSVGGAVSGALIGSGAAIVGAVYAGTSSAAAAIATGSAIGAGANVIGDATSQVIENYKNGLSIGDSFTNIDGARLAIAGASGAAFGTFGGGSNVLSAQVRASTRTVQSTLQRNLNSYSAELYRQGSSTSTIHSVQNSIVNGMGQAGRNSATSIGLIGTGIEVIGVGTAIGTNQLQNGFPGSSNKGFK